jgi:hypothetical protein
MFLRGGDDSNYLVFESDSIQDHLHVDNQHTHVDETGHKHSHEDCMRERYHTNLRHDNDGGEPMVSDNDECNGDKSTGDTFVTLASSSSEITNVDPLSANVDGETRPVNKRVIYIMKIDDTL